MVSTGPPFKIVGHEDELDLRAHYEMVAQNALRLFWQRRRLIAASVVLAFLIGIIALAQMEPRYRSEALIQVDLNLNPDSNTKSPSTASVNAAEVVDSTVRIIGSRANADAVVARLGLDKDPRFEHQPRLSRWLSAVRSVLGLQLSVLTPHDLAVDALLRQIRVTAEPRSYLVSVAANAGDPKTAAELANAIAVEYLRTRMLKELAEERAAREYELTDAALVYGPRHPTYLRAARRLEQLEARLAALRDASTTEDLIKAETGHSLIAAQQVAKPSSPNIPLILMLAVLAGLGLGVSLARYTPVGRVEHTFATALEIVLAATYALIGGIFALAKACWAARRLALPVELFNPITELARSAARPIGLARTRRTLRRKIATVIGAMVRSIARATERATKLAAGCMRALRALRRPLRRFFRMTTFLRGISTLLDPLKKVAHAKDHDPSRSALGVAPPSRRSPVGWRSLPSLTLCLAIIGFTTIPGNAVSALGYQIIQSIRVFQMPDLGAWIGPARDHVIALLAPNRPSPVDDKLRAENSVPSAAYSAAELPAIRPGAEPLSVPRPARGEAAAAAAPATPASDPEPIAPSSVVPPGTGRTAAMPWTDYAPSAVIGEPQADNAIPSAAAPAEKTSESLPAAEPVSVARPAQATAPAITAPAIRSAEPGSTASSPPKPAAMERTPAVPATEPRLPAAASAVLVERGDTLVRARDVASARLFYERAAEMGDGRGALRMGATFDAAFLDRTGIRGIPADRREALSWYRRARALGDTDADRVIKALEPQ